MQMSQPIRGEILIPPASLIQNILRRDELVVATLTIPPPARQHLARDRHYLRAWARPQVADDRCFDIHRFHRSFINVPALIIVSAVKNRRSRLESASRLRGPGPAKVSTSSARGPGTGRNDDQDRCASVKIAFVFSAVSALKGSMALSRIGFASRSNISSLDSIGN